MNEILIVTSVICNGLAQIFLKLGSRDIQFDKLFLEVFLSLITNVYILGGLFLYGVSILLWIYILSKVEVSYAYPFLSLGFIFVMIVGVFFLKEHLNMFKFLGMGCIILGVLLIYKS